MILNYSHTEKDPIQTMESLQAWGLHTMIDLRECKPEWVQSKERIKDYLIELCDEILKVTRFGFPHIIHFGKDPHVSGFSMFQLIETSNVSGHFREENNSIYLDIFSCKPYDPRMVIEFSTKWFEAKYCDYKWFYRR